MTLRLPRSAAASVVLAAAAAFAAGCSSGPDAKGTVDSMGAFGLEVAKVKDSIDSTVRALESVVGSKPADINANLEAYSKAVAALGGQAEVVRGRAEEMRTKGDEFFEEWEDPEDVTPERRAELTAAYAKIKTDMTAAKDAFIPFLASLRDVESYLKVDPSTKGLQSMSALVKTAKDNGTKVKSLIDQVLVQVNSVRGMLTTS